MLINDKKKMTGRKEWCNVMPSRTRRRLSSVDYLKHDFLKLSLSLLGSG